MTYEEDVANEIVACIWQVDYEYETMFRQFKGVGNEIDVETEDGEWFTIKVSKRPLNPPQK